MSGTACRWHQKDRSWQGYSMDIQTYRHNRGSSDTDLQERGKQPTCELQAWVPYLSTQQAPWTNRRLEKPTTYNTPSSMGSPRANARWQTHKKHSILRQNPCSTTFPLTTFSWTSPRHLTPSPIYVWSSRLKPLALLVQYSETCWLPIK